MIVKRIMEGIESKEDALLRTNSLNGC